MCSFYLRFYYLFYAALARNRTLAMPPYIQILTQIIHYQTDCLRLYERTRCSLTATATPGVIGDTWKRVAEMVNRINVAHFAVQNEIWRSM